jgi:hypothetical protein
MILGRGSGLSMLRRCCVVSEEIWVVIVWREMGMEWSMVFVCEVCPNGFSLSFLRIFPGGYDTRYYSHPLSIRPILAMPL